jgi:hypothetical protein
VLLHRPAYFEQVVERVGAESFRDPDLRQIFVAMGTQGAEAGPDVLAEHLGGDAVVMMQELLEEPGGLDHADEAVTGSLKAMHERNLTERLSEIDRELPIASDSQKDELTTEKRMLMEELRRLGGRWWKKFR